jgi:serine/threonine protein kinase
MAPEVHSKMTASMVGYAPGPADVFSAGVCFFIMLTGMTPWSAPTRSDPFFRHVYVGTYKLDPTVPNRCRVCESLNATSGLADLPL